MKTPPIGNVYSSPQAPARTSAVSLEARRALGVIEHALEDHPATVTALRMLIERLNRGGEPVEVVFLTGASEQKFIAADMLARAVSGRRPQLTLKGATLANQVHLADLRQTPEGSRAFFRVEGAPSPAALKKLVDHLHRSVGPAGAAVLVDIRAGREALPAYAAAIDPGALGPKTPLGWTEIHFG